MKTLSAVGFQKCLVRLLVMPRFVARAGLHDGHDVDEPGMFTAFGQDLLDVLVLTHRLRFADELDLQVVLDGNTLRIGPYLVTQLLGESRVVEDPDALGV